jgi:hypothetical protein
MTPSGKEFGHGELRALVTFTMAVFGACLGAISILISMMENYPVKCAIYTQPM